MKNAKKYLIPSFIVIVALLLVYAIKGIYPFGNVTIANGDMGQSYIPNYYYMYDVIHGEKSIFYNYNLGMGSNMYGSIIVGGMLNPLNYIILLNSRENIPYMFSFVLMIKMVCIALSSYFLFNKLFKNNNFYNVIFSVLYAFSGYALMYNTNIMWLDVVALFPLFILAIKHMFETHKIYWYTIVLTLILLMSYNLAYMVLLFIIFILPIYIFIKINKEERKKVIFSLMLGTGLAAGLSAFAVVPAFIQTMTSYRMSSGTPFVTTNSNIYYKMVMFFVYTLPVYGFVKWIKYYKEDKSNLKIALLSLLFSAILPIIFEGINLMWHGGSYQCFPFRYGFIPLMILYLGALRYYSEFHNKEKRKKDDKVFLIINIIIAVFFIVLAVLTAYIININFPAFTMDQNIFVLISIICYFGIVLLISAYKKENEKIRDFIIISITVIQVLTYVYAYVGTPVDTRKGAEWSDEGVFVSNEIYSKFKDINTLYRLKDLTLSTTENDSLVFNKPSISTFLHIVPTEQITNCEQMGYSNRKTQLNDYGGTLISDAVYGVKYVLSYKDLPEELYNYLFNINDEIKAYEYKYTLPNTILCNNCIDNIPDNLKSFDAQNYLYKNMFNKTEDIINVLEDINPSIFKYDFGEYSFVLDFDADKELYLDINELREVIPSIKINDKLVEIPILNDKYNLSYPNSYCNGILDLGFYKAGQTIKIEFECLDSKKLSLIKFATLDIEKYKDVIKENQNDININVEKNKIIIEGNIGQDKCLFVPVIYDSNWKIIEGDSSLKRIYNTFIGLSLKQGYNKIVLEFKPPYFDYSLICSISVIAILIIMYLIEKKWNIRNVKWVMFLCFIIGIIVYLVALYFIYLKPLINLLSYFKLVLRI